MLNVDLQSFSMILSLADLFHYRKIRVCFTTLWLRVVYLTFFLTNPRCCLFDQTNNYNMLQTVEASIKCCVFFIFKKFKNCGPHTHGNIVHKSFIPDTVGDMHEL